MNQTVQNAPVLDNHPLFTRHPEAAQALAAHMRCKTYPKDTAIARHGDAADSLWLVYRGWVKLMRQTPDGKETIIGLCTEGDLFGEAALFPNANYPYHAQVVGADAELAAVPASVVRTLIAKDASLSNSIMSLLNERMAQAQLKLEHMTTMSAAQRLGCFLLRLCSQGDGERTLQIPVEKHILAAYLGMKPETFSRSQQQLKQLGIEVNGATITVGDVEKLRDFVCNSCSESGACDVEAAAS